MVLGPPATIVPLPPATSGFQHTAFGVFLSPVGFRVARFGIGALHLVCAGYFVAAGVVYWTLPPTRVARMLQFYSLTLHASYFRRIAIVHFLFAAVHLHILGTAAVVSIANRVSGDHLHRQATSLKRQLTTLRRPTLTLHPVFAKASGLAAAVMATKPGRMLQIVYTVLLSPRGFFGVEGVHFETLFLCREVFETLLQGQQAYTMSRLLPRAQLIRFYVAMLVLNCWATPFLHRFGGRNPALQRMLCLLCDIALDFISVAGVPSWLTLDYFGSYDPTITDFPDSLWYNDTWLVRFMNDAPLILLSSWVEAFSRLFFSLSLVSTIDDVKNLIKRKRIADRISAVIPGPTTAHKFEHLRLVVWTHRLMVLAGITILAIHLHAESRRSPPSCALEVRPWLISRPACALIEINCFTDPTLARGGRVDFESVFGNLDTASLEHIVVRHCSELEITPRFQTFTNLIGIKTYNSTLETWQENAAITQSFHPQLRFLYFVLTDFPNATLPSGLLSSEFPKTLKDVEICGTNINRLPDELHMRWPQELTLFIEYGQLTEFPSVLIQMNPQMLSLCWNKVTEIPPEALVQPAMYLAAFTGNPIGSLPETGVTSSDVHATYLFVDTTRFDGPLPLWVDEAFVGRTTLYLGGSPFCSRVLLNESSAERAELLATRPYALGVDCAVQEEQSFYPLGVDNQDPST